MCFETFQHAHRSAVEAIGSWIAQARLAGLWAGLLLLVGLAGCGNRTPPAPPDPVQAREALRTALDAWQQGVQPESLKDAKPPMLVVDYEWRSGKRLLGYQIQGEGEMYGPSLRCPVLLTLEGIPGQPVQQEVVYSVATLPSVSVFRDDP